MNNANNKNQQPPQQQEQQQHKPQSIRIKKNHVPQSVKIKQLLQNSSSIPNPKLLPKSILNYSKTQICPQCNLPVPINEMEQHLKIELLDPKWKAQKDRELQKKRESNLIVDRGMDVAKNLKNFASVRKDIFGGDLDQVEKEIQLKKRLAAEKEIVAWDGHESSMNNTIRKVANLPENSIQKQFAYIHQQQQEFIGPHFKKRKTTS